MGNTGIDYTYIYIHIYIYIYVCMYICMYMCTCMCIGIYRVWGLGLILVAEF